MFGLCCASNRIISQQVLTEFRPFNAMFYPAILQKAGTPFNGMMIIYGSGEIAFTDIGFTTNFWTVGANCGLLRDYVVSFII